MTLRTNPKFIYDSQTSIGDDDCQNILIQGDNKDVLPQLWHHFAEKIKCIYIDPPYNNGELYHYYNDNTTQTNWLSDMHRVLNLLRPLLTEDGSLWISIDDSEMAYLKTEADAIFGKENFAGTIIWQQRKSRENRAVFSVNHEYILVYAKNLKSFKKSRNLLPVTEEHILTKYKNPDNDPRGPWQSVTASVQAGHAVASQFYTITSPTGVKHAPPKGRCWIYNEERMRREIELGNIWFGKDGRNAPRVKKFLSQSSLGLTPQTIWLADEVGTSDSAKKQLMAMFPDSDKIFETPKPEELLKRIIEIASNKGDYVLDCYAGSGTTMAVAHKLNRHYVGIEVGNHISELVANRISRVVSGEQSGISASIGWQGGGNFAFYHFDKNSRNQSVYPAIRTQHKSLREQPVQRKTNTYKQLNLFDALQQYPDYIVENSFAHEDAAQYCSPDLILNQLRNVLICNVKADNLQPFMTQSASIYYTGKKFPATIELDKLFFFMPYIKHKGIRDLYLIKLARIGTRKEGQVNNDPNDLRIVFEIVFVQQLFKDYVPIELKIWRTYTKTDTFALLDMHRQTMQ